MTETQEREPTPLEMRSGRVTPIPNMGEAPLSGEVRGLRALVAEQQTRIIQLERQQERVMERMATLVEGLGQGPDPLQAQTAEALFRLQGHVEAARGILRMLSDDLQGMGRVYQGVPLDEAGTSEEA